MRAVFEAKLERVRRFMAAEGLHNLVLARLDTVAWLTDGARAHVPLNAELAAATVVVTPDRVYVVANTIEAPRLADEELADLPVELIAFDWHDAVAESAIAPLLAPGRTGADLPAPGRELVAVQPLRYPLLPEEQERYRELGRDVGHAIGLVARQLEPGETEQSIAGRLAQALFERGIWPQVLLVAADERLDRYRHPLPGPARVRRRVLLVTGGKRAGLVASVSRLVAFGAVDDSLRRRHEAVCRVDATLMAHTQPGAAVADVLAAGLAAYAAEGFPDEWRRHHQGGAAGYLSRDYRATLSSCERVHEGQAFAWNPTIAGTKSEDTMLARAAGPEVLTASWDWPMNQCEVAGRRLARPEILVR